MAHDLKSLEDLNLKKPIYFLPKDDIINEVYIPCLKLSDRYDCMTAFFHNNSFKELAFGISDFINNQNGVMRLLISPYLSIEDQEALHLGCKDSEETLKNFLTKIYGDKIINSSSLEQHTLKCLAYLISCNRISIKVVCMKGGLFHPKVKIFSHKALSIVVHGSDNFTAAGLKKNIEQVTVIRSWINQENYELINIIKNQFNDFWNNLVDDDIFIFELPEAIKMNILNKFNSSTPPTNDDFLLALEKENDYMNNNKINSNFIIPEYLNYTIGDFKHQGEAVGKWIASNYRGILEMATGSGKTITSLIAANKLFNFINSQLLIIISVPTLPLINQWYDESCKFGLKPITFSSEKTKKEKIYLLNKIVRNLRYEISMVECIIITNNFLVSEDFRSIIKNLNKSIMLIADEVHNLGTALFYNEAPEFIEYRLGLSATPIRQYDEIGTDKILNFFGDIVYQFTLQDAIGKCLVPYNYHVHVVLLTETEADKWMEITSELKKLGWTDKNNDFESKIDNYINKLLRDRRLIIEQSERKIAVLKDLLIKNNPKTIKHTLIYTSDKYHKQLELVNKLLKDDLKIKFHQITSHESGMKGLTTKILEDFSHGEKIQIITAMRVLDEGVDIPAIKTAYILASTTVRRQWIQRRGRVLRKSNGNTKEIAEIHDFFVIPPKNYPLDKIINSELDRIFEFAKTARNAMSENGPIDTIKEFIK